MPRPNWILIALIAALTGCLTTPKPSDAFLTQYQKAESKLSVINADISETTARAKSSGAPTQVATEYASVASRFNTYLTYYTGCIQATTCDTTTLDQHEKNVSDSYRAYVETINAASSTTAQDPLTAAAVLTLLKEATPIAKDIYAWLKENREQQTAAAEAKQKELLEKLRNDWKLKDW